MKQECVDRCTVRYAGKLGFLSTRPPDCGETEQELAECDARIRLSSRPAVLRAQKAACTSREAPRAEEERLLVRPAPWLSRVERELAATRLSPFSLTQRSSLQSRTRSSTTACALDTRPITCTSRRRRRATSHLAPPPLRLRLSRLGFRASADPQAARSAPHTYLAR